VLSISSTETCIDDGLVVFSDDESVAFKIPYNVPWVLRAIESPTHMTDLP
jgi:hypothetical protein